MRIAGDLSTRYSDVRSTTERLASPLSAEDQTVQSMPDVSPTKWHRAHTAWFFETFILGPSLDGYEPFDPSYAYLFNSYYEALGARHTRAERGLLSRPGIDDIARYRSHVDHHVKLVLGADLDDTTATLIELGLHHEQQHQELLLMDIKHVLGSNPVEPTYRVSGRADVPTPATGWVELEGGTVEIGHAGGGFAFDNESPRHAVHLAPYAVAMAPVSCAEWMAFITDGGYDRPELWLSDGWAAVQQLRWHAPLYWRRDEPDDPWRRFSLHGPGSVDATEPVCHISYYEADAFARWAGCRLPTEAEWEHATVSLGWSSTERFDLEDLQPRAAAAGSIGEVWEWTASAYLPYPGFRAAPGAVGEYNGKFMVSQHVLRGGACVTPTGHSRPTYRNFYPPGARWPFTGLRLARDL
jgi:ergothioneine biosynthesis protein EgtB